MINDVLTSGRGPGIIGTILAAIVLGGFSGLALMVFNESGGGTEATVEEQLATQQTRLANLDLQIEEQTAQLKVIGIYQERKNELKKCQNSLAQKTKELTTFQTAQKLTQETLHDFYDQWENYKASYRKNERALWKGRVIDLSSIRGSDYQSAKISSITPLAIRVMLSAGPRSVPYEELPSEIQDQLQFDKGEAAAFTAHLMGQEVLKAENAKAWNKQQAELQAQNAATTLILKRTQIQRLIRERNSQINARLDEASRWQRRIVEANRKSSSGRSKGNVTIKTGLTLEYEEKKKNAERIAKELREKISLLELELRNIDR